MKEKIINKVIEKFVPENDPETIEELKTDLLNEEGSAIDMVWSYLRANKEYDLMNAWEELFY